MKKFMLIIFAWCLLSVSAFAGFNSDVFADDMFIDTSKHNWDSVPLQKHTYYVCKISIDDYYKHRFNSNETYNEFAQRICQKNAMMNNLRTTGFIAQTIPVGVKDRMTDYFIYEAVNIIPPKD